MRAVLHTIGNKPHLAVALEDGSQFVIDGEVVSPDVFKRDFREVSNAGETGALVVAADQSAPEPEEEEEEPAPKAKAKRSARSRNGVQ